MLDSLACIPLPFWFGTFLLRVLLTRIRDCFEKSTQGNFDATKNSRVVSPNVYFSRLAV